MGIVFAFDLFVLFFKAEIQKDLIEKIKIGVKRGFDRSESFFKQLFEKKQSLNETLEVSKIKEKEKKNSQNFDVFKDKKETQFKKIEIEIDSNQ